jgi:hypothetical protein
MAVYWSDAKLLLMSYPDIGKTANWRAFCPLDSPFHQAFTTPKDGFPSLGRAKTGTFECS